MAAMAASRSFSVQAMVCGYHIYKTIWEATIDGELLACEREVGNIHDTFAVAVKKDRIIVGQKFLHCVQFLLGVEGQFTAK